MNTEILPLGTVVTLENGDGSLLMVMARASIVQNREGEEVYYDYGAVLIPQGMLTPEAVYFFNRENVKEVLFRGFENEDEKSFAEHYDSVIAGANLSKGVVSNSKDD